MDKEELKEVMGLLQAAGMQAMLCDTEDAVCKSTVTDTDINSYTTNRVELGVTYLISVYATKEGFEDSDEATATLCWIEVEPNTEEPFDGVKEVQAHAVLIQGRNGIVTVTGVDAGTQIAVYSIGGQMAGAATAHGTQTEISTGLGKGEVAIVRIGERAVKVVMQ